MWKLTFFVHLYSLDDPEPLLKVKASVRELSVDFLGGQLKPAMSLLFLGAHRQLLKESRNQTEEMDSSGRAGVYRT